MIIIGIVVYVLGVVGLTVFFGFRGVGIEATDFIGIALWPSTLLLVALCYICSAPYNFGKYLARRKKNNG